MEIHFFARFHAREGKENDAREAFREVLLPSREEPGCLSIHMFRSTQDARLFYIHSHWKSEVAFEIHANLPHTVRFLKRIEPLLDHAFDGTRTELIG